MSKKLLSLFIVATLILVNGNGVIYGIDSIDQLREVTTTEKDIKEKSEKQESEEDIISKGATEDGIISEIITDEGTDSSDGEGDNTQVHPTLANSGNISLFSTNEVEIRNSDDWYNGFNSTGDIILKIMNDITVNTSAYDMDTEIRSITILNEDNYTISVSGGGTLFPYINNNPDIVIDLGGTYFKSVKSKNNAFIINNSNITINGNNSSFTGFDNLTEPSIENGSVIYVDASKIVINDVNILNSKGFHGGAIHSEGSNLTINRGEISGNTANGNGGGIYVNTPEDYPGIVSEVNLVDINLLNNKSYDRGGAISVHDTNMNISGGKIDKNITDGDGGGIYSNCSNNVIIKNISITENEATGLSTEPGQDPGFGGGVYATNSDKITLENVIIDGNKSLENGGGIYTYLVDDISIIGDSISNNISNANGGGFYAHTLNNITIKDISILENKATLSGGGIYGFNSEKFTLENLVIDNNNSEDSGGGVYLHTSKELNINTVKFDTNTAKNYGGGIYVYNIKGLDIKGTILDNNTAGYYGGGLYTHSSGLDLTNTSFTNNKSGENGGGLYAKDYIGNINILGGEVRGNELTTKPLGGAGLYFDQGSEDDRVNIISIKDTLFDNNIVSAGGSIGGGAIAICPSKTIAPNSKLLLEDITMTNNKGIYGGAIRSTGYDIEVIGESKFENNEAYINGGAIHTSNYLTAGSTNDRNLEQNFTIGVGVEFNKNKAEFAGGAILADQVNMGIDSALFKSNSAGRNGGVINILGKDISGINDGRVVGKLEISGKTIFDGNTAISNSGKAFGGAINHHRFRLPNTRFEDQVLKIGEEVVFTNNKASRIAEQILYSDKKFYDANILATNFSINPNDSDGNEFEYGLNQYDMNYLETSDTYSIEYVDSKNAIDIDHESTHYRYIKDDLVDLYKPTVTLEGFEFIGWDINGTSIFTKDSITFEDSDIVATAIWKEKTGGGGTIDPNPNPDPEIPTNPDISPPDKPRPKDKETETIELTPEIIPEGTPEIKEEIVPEEIIEIKEEEIPLAEAEVEKGKSEVKADKVNPKTGIINNNPIYLLALTGLGILGLSKRKKNEEII